MKMANSDRNVKVSDTCLLAGRQQAMIVVMVPTTKIITACKFVNSREEIISDT
jgi:hypothetical protein